MILNTSNLKFLNDNKIKGKRYIIILSLLAMILEQFARFEKRAFFFLWSVSWIMNLASNEIFSVSTRNEKPIVAQLFAKSRNFYGTWKLITVFTHPTSEPDKSNPRPQIPSLTIHSIIFKCMPTTPKWPHSFRFVDKYFVCICKLPHACPTQQLCYLPYLIILKSV